MSEALARLELGMAYLRKEMYPEAVANMEKAVAIGRNDPDELLFMAALTYA